MSFDCDIAIAGGGLVGASLAAALAPLGLRVVVIEAHRPGRPGQPSFDDRCTALAAASQRIFSALGCWDKLAADACAIRSIHVSDQGRFGQTRLGAAEQGETAFGYVVENRQLGHTLWQRLEALNTELLAPASVGHCSVHDDRVVLEITDADGTRELQTRLLVAADGARSAIREGLGVGTRVWDYGQVAFVANLEPGRDHAHVAYERFAESGPMALLPMQGRRCNLVWTVPADRAEAVRGWSDETFLAELQTAFGFRLGRFRRAGGRSSYPLALVRARRQTCGRVLFLGNSAHGLHPVAGQGFNLSLRDAAALAECLADRPDGDPGAPDLLARYLRWRRADQRSTVAFSDALIRIFGNPLGPVRLARSAGLLGLELLPPARTALARRGMGLAHSVPRLARGVPLS